MQLKRTFAVLSLLGASLAAPQSTSVPAKKKPCRPVSGSSSRIGSSLSNTYSSSPDLSSSSTEYVGSSSTDASSRSSSSIENTSSTTSVVDFSSTSSTATVSTSESITSAAPASTSTSVSSTTSVVTSSATGYPVPTPGVEMPTNSYTETIASFTTGTPVSIQDPSFENTSSSSEGDSQRKRAKRQSTAQVAAGAEGWTIQSCGTGDSSDCLFENYDAADGTWAFSGKRGGLLYQDGINLAAGSSYAFTFYWKVVSTYDGATSSSTGNKMTQAIYLGSSANSDVTTAFVPTVGSATVESGGDWVQQTFTLTLSCQYANFATAVRSDGSLDFRMFLQGKTASGTIGDFLWYVDEIRVQQLSPPTGGTLAYLTNTCKITPPATTTSATSTYTVTQTYDATTTPTAGTNVLGNPSFESVAVTESTDVNGYPLKASDWTSTGCAGRQCQLYQSGSGSVTCQDGSRCEYWRASTTYSRTLTVDIGATYFLSVWALLVNVPTETKSGSSVVKMTIAAPGATPGTGGLILSVEIGSITPEWVQFTKMLDLNTDFAQSLCGAADGDTTATCQITLSTAYTGTWNTTDNLLNYFDNVSFFEVS